MEAIVKSTSNGELPLGQSRAELVGNDEWGVETSTESHRVVAGTKSSTDMGEEPTLLNGGHETRAHQSPNDSRRYSPILGATQEPAHAPHARRAVDVGRQTGDVPLLVWEEVETSSDDASDSRLSHDHSATGWSRLPATAGRSREPESSICLAARVAHAVAVGIVIVSLPFLSVTSSSDSPSNKSSAPMVASAKCSACVRAAATRSYSKTTYVRARPSRVVAFVENAGLNSDVRMVMQDSDEHRCTSHGSLCESGLSIQNDTHPTSDLVSTVRGVTTSRSSRSMWARFSDHDLQVKRSTGSTTISVTNQGTSGGPLRSSKHVTDRTTRSSRLVASRGASPSGLRSMISPQMSFAGDSLEDGHQNSL
jgi:hypothetical protein